MKLLLTLLVFLSLSYGYDSEIESVTIKSSTKSNKVVINGKEFITGATYVLDFMNKELRAALEEAVASHNKNIIKVVFKSFK